MFRFQMASELGNLLGLGVKGLAEGPLKEGLRLWVWCLLWIVDAAAQD